MSTVVELKYVRKGIIDQMILRSSTDLSNIRIASTRQD